MCQPDYPDGGPQFQQVPAQLHHLRGLPATGPVPMLDITTKESMLDWSAYQEVKLITSLGRDMLLTCSPSTWVPQPLLFSSSTFQISSASFHLWGRGMVQHFCRPTLNIWLGVPAQMCWTLYLKTLFRCKQLSLTKPPHGSDLQNCVRKNILACCRQIFCQD